METVGDVNQWSNCLCECETMPLLYQSDRIFSACQFQPTWHCAPHPGNLPVPAGHRESQSPYFCVVLPDPKGRP